jgi:hypothetical protein
MHDLVHLLIFCFFFQPLAYHIFHYNLESRVEYQIGHGGPAAGSRWDWYRLDLNPVNESCKLGSKTNYRTFFSCSRVLHILLTRFRPFPQIQLMQLGKCCVSPVQSMSLSRPSLLTVWHISSQKQIREIIKSSPGSAQSKWRES